MKRVFVRPETKAPQFVLVVRERLRPGSEEADDKNERQLAIVCARMKCPHPYLALASVAGPTEVWWLNAFASQEERDGLGAAYAGNEALMAEMRPLGKRKEDFREAFTSSMMTYRRDSSSGAVLRIAGAFVRRRLVARKRKSRGPPRQRKSDASTGLEFFE